MSDSEGYDWRNEAFSSDKRPRRRLTSIRELWSSEAFQKYGPFLAAAFFGLLVAWLVASGCLGHRVGSTWQINADGNEITKLASSGDGEWIGALDSQGVFALWNLDSKVFGLRLDSSLRDFAIAPDLRWLAIIGSKGEARICRLRLTDAGAMKTGDWISLPSLGTVERIVFSPDGAALGVSSEDSSLKICRDWERSTPSVIFGEEPDSSFSNLGWREETQLGKKLTFSPEGSQLVLLDLDDINRFEGVDAKTGDLIGFSSSRSSSQSSNDVWWLGGRAIGGSRISVGPDSSTEYEFLDVHYNGVGKVLRISEGEQESIVVGGKDGVVYHVVSAPRWRWVPLGLAVVWALWWMLASPNSTGIQLDRRFRQSTADAAEVINLEPSRHLRLVANLVFLNGLFFCGWMIHDLFHDAFYIRVEALCVFAGPALRRWRNGWRRFVLILGLLSALAIGLMIGAWIPEIRSDAISFSKEEPTIFDWRFLVEVVTMIAMVFCVSVLRDPLIRHRFKIEGSPALPTRPN